MDDIENTAYYHASNLLHAFLETYRLNSTGKIPRQTGVRDTLASATAAIFQSAVPAVGTLIGTAIQSLCQSAIDKDHMGRAREVFYQFDSTLLLEVSTVMELRLLKDSQLHSSH